MLYAFTHTAICSDGLIIFNITCHFRLQLQDLYNELHKVYRALSTLTYLLLLPFTPSPSNSLLLFTPPLGQDLKCRV